MRYISALFRFSIYTVKILFYNIASIFYRDKKKFKNAYLFCERGDEARDNAYWMFKYYRENHPEVNSYYVISKNNTKDYDKVKKLGPTIEFKSFEHQMAIIFSDTYVSAHTGYLIPYNYRLFRFLTDFRRKKKFIFLQHGIIYNDLSFHLSNKLMPIDLFITSIREEYNYLNRKLDYPKGVIKLTGLARFDNLNEYKTKRYILFMPSWRNYILTASYKNKNSSKEVETFMASEYYKRFYSLLNSSLLQNMLKENNLELWFYPHYEVQKFINLFQIQNSKIKILNREDYYIPDLLKEAKVLITDYSSVFFDFAYMKKPSIYYQFDQEEFYEKQYAKGYFRYERDAFGEVVKDEKELIKALKEIIDNDFELEKVYRQRVDRTFKYRDDKNCARIAKEIEDLKNEAEV